MKKESKKTRSRNARVAKINAETKGTCWLCGKVGQTEGHHAYPKGRYPDMVEVPENIFPLCFDCHDEADEVRAMFREIVMAREPERHALIEALAFKSRTCGRVA